jgi:hypothetical protein
MVRQFKFSNFALLVLVLVLSVLLCVLIWALWPTLLQPTSASVVISCLTALVALCISLRAQQIQDRYRTEDRDREAKTLKAERDEAIAKQCEKKSQVSNLFVAQIATWLGRKDLYDLRYDMAIADIKIVDVKFRIELQIQERERTGFSAEANILEEDDWTNALADLKEVLRLPSTRGFSTIPNIWATQFSRDDLELFRTDVLIFFIGMNAVWANISHMAQDLPSGDDALAFIEGNQPDKVSQFLQLISDYINQLRRHFIDFIDLAKRFTHAIKRESTEPIPNPLALVLSSQITSSGIKQLKQQILWEQQNERSKAAMEKIKNKIAAFEKSNAASERVLQEYLNTAQGTIDQIEKLEKSRRADNVPGDGLL